LPRKKKYYSSAKKKKNNTMNDTSVKWMTFGGEKQQEGRVNGERVRGEYDRSTSHACLRVK
jgi:hypothetical protein